MIYQYIKELIENNNRIIIPDFGAFMIQSSPEGKQISFNDFLKFNDGLLINQIIKAEKVSKTQATESVKAFISEIEKAFSQNKPYEIKELGFLVKDEHGNIKFQEKVETPTPVVEEVKAEKPTETLATDSTPIIELAEEKEIIKEEVKKEVVIPKAEAPKTVEPVKAEIKKEEPKVEEKAIPEIKPRAKEEKPKMAIPSRPVSKPIEKKAIPATPKSTKPLDKPKVGTTKQAAKNSDSKSSKSTLLIVAVVVVIVGIFGTGYFMGWFEKKAEPVVVEAPIVVPVVKDTTPIMEEPKVVEEPDQDPNAKKYYIVAGSFKVPSNAEGFQQKLMDQGFDSEIVVRNNGFHTVSYKTLYEWSEALTEWRNMRASNEQTWILVR